MSPWNIVPSNFVWGHLSGDSSKHFFTDRILGMMFANTTCTVCYSTVMQSALQGRRSSGKRNSLSLSICKAVNGVGL